MPSETVVFSARGPINWSTPDGSPITAVTVEPETSFCFWGPTHPSAIQFCPLGGAFYEQLAINGGALPVTGASDTYLHDFDTPYSDNTGNIVLTFTYGEAVGGQDRVRSHVSEDAGSLFQATQAVAVENAVSEAFPYGVALTQGSLYPFREALTPDQIAAFYYPISTRNQEMLSTFEGETKLGRMARVYPSRIMARIEDLDEFGGETSATAQEAIQYIFNQWASEFSWFTFETVPDLRLLVSAAVGAPRQHYIDNPSDGVVSVNAIVIAQEADSRQTMREIVDEWLGIFPGTVVRQNAAGNIELVPRVGPDAPSDAAVDLEWRDIISISDGEDDPKGVINRARVVSRGWADEADQALIEPAYYLTPGGLDEAVLTDQGVHPEDDPRVEVSAFRRMEFTKLVTGDDVTVSVGITVYGNGDDDTASGFYTEATKSEDITLSPGETKSVAVTYTVQTQTTTFTVYVKRTEDGDAIVMSHTGGFTQATAGFTNTYLKHVVTLDVTGTAWTKATGDVTGEFGYSTTDTIPGADGGNVITDSVNLYGEREATINSTVFQLEGTQAQQVAQAHVLFNINPKTIRDVQQSEWEPYPVKFDHVGRLVDLPNGERAVVENRAYSDSFTPGGGLMQSAFTATVAEQLIDTDTAFLYLDDGSYMQLDDGSIAEEQ